MHSSLRIALKSAPKFRFSKRLIEADITSGGTTFSAAKDVYVPLCAFLHDFGDFVGPFA